MDAFSLEESYHGSVLILQRIVADAENQSKGLVLIVDYEDLSLDQIRRVTPSYLKKLGDLSHVLILKLFFIAYISLTGHQYFYLNIL